MNNNLSYIQQGHGPTLVILHGWLASKELWNPFIPLFARDFNVIAVDLPGFGKSKRVTFSDIYEYSEIVFTYIKEFVGEDNYYLIGNSLGGTIASIIATRHPSSIIRFAAIVAPISYKQLIKPLQNKLLINLLKTTSNITAFKSFYKNLFYKKWAKMHSGYHSVSDEAQDFLEKFSKDLKQSASYRTTHLLGFDITSLDLIDKLKTNTVKGIHIVNKQERIVRYIPAVYKNLRNIKLKVIDSPEHSILHSDPKELVNMIKDFLLD